MNEDLNIILDEIDGAYQALHQARTTRGHHLGWIEARLLHHAFHPHGKHHRG